MLLNERPSAKKWSTFDAAIRWLRQYAINSILSLEEGNEDVYETEENKK